jgi:hypothetical protein
MNALVNPISFRLGLTDLTVNYNFLDSIKNF